MMKNNYKVLIISCWSLLLVCCLIKLLGADLFLAGTDNERFISLCSFIDTTILRYVILYVMNIVSTSIYFMAVLKEKKPNIKWLVPYIIYVILKFIFEDFTMLFFIFDMLITIGLPILIDKKKWLRIIIGMGLNIGFQIISMFLKFDKFTMFDNNTLVFTILSIDYYIMLILYWLYSIKEKRGVEQ